MNRNIFCNAAILTLVVPGLFLAGCATSKPPPAVMVDVAPALAAASTRPAMKPGSIQHSVVLTVAGPIADKKDLGIGSRYIETGGDPTAGDIASLFAGDENAGKRILATPQPVGTYIQAAFTSALASRNIGLSDAAPVRLDVTLDRFEYDMLKSGDRIRKAWIECGLTVNDSTSGHLTYSRKFAVESSVERGNNSAAIDTLGAISANIIGIGPSGAPARRNEERQAAQAALSGAISKLEDEIAGDTDLIKALGE